MFSSSVELSAWLNSEVKVFDKAWNFIKSGACSYVVQRSYILKNGWRQYASLIEWIKQLRHINTLGFEKPEIQIPSWYMMIYCM